MRFSPEEIQIIVKTHYGLDVEVQALDGYEEDNYLLRCRARQRNILKVTSGEQDVDQIAGQIAMMDHLAVSFGAHHVQRVLNVEQPAAKSPHPKLLCIQRGESRYYLRLLSFLEGTFWFESKNKSEKALESLGDFLGKVDKALSHFSHRGLHRRIPWDISRAAEAIPNLPFIQDPARRRPADYFLLQFQTRALPVIPFLRHAYIHNDANDHNVLMEGEQVTGLIDFGDAIYTALINNVAIACTYAILGEENPLEAAAHLVKAYHGAYPLQAEEVDILYDLIAARLCISVTQSAFHAAHNSDNNHHFLTEKPAWDLLERWIRISPVKATDTFRKSCGFVSTRTQTDDYAATLQARKKLIGPNLSISYQQPLKIVQGALQYLYDDRGNTFVDCVNNVSHVGHCHPTLVRAMQKQIATLNTNTRYLHDAMLEYARELTSTLPEPLRVCYFVNSGSEANDLAIRMARHYTGRQDVIVLDHAYHGTSTLAIEMSPYKFDGPNGIGQKSYIHKGMSPDLYRGNYRYGDEQAGDKYAASISRIAADLEAKGTPAAAFICETLLGVGGQIPLPPGYLAKAYVQVRRHGGLCIADEVQVGFGRVGDCFWGFELQEVVPDIVVMGKPMGNGHPLAAVVVTEPIAKAFGTGPEYFNTFGGNPVSMVTGLTVLRILRDEQLQQHARETGNYLMKLLRELMEEFPIIGDVRGHGLFIGAEFVKSRESREPARAEIDWVVEQMKHRGFLLSTDGPYHNVLKIKPPLVFNQENAHCLVQHLREILKNMTP